MPKYTTEENRRWQNSLPAKRIAADALLWNDQGQLLIVKTNYRDKWQLPGGVVDEAESPLDAVVREVKEELSLDIPKESFQLRVVMYTPEYDGFKDFLALTFWGGILAEEQIRHIRADEDELEAFQFVDMHKAQELLKASLALRAKVAQTGSGPYFLIAPSA
jgi:8-oxo-dGTP diphosphatase